MDIGELQARARQIADPYDRHHAAAGVLVLAHRYDVDLVAEFDRMTDGIERHIG